ncbi:hypothetical protein [Prescottella equi]|uniref:hypothetical protein n=1 Tax=Rhodococcus hoagii TaxID=43767 RepID=UPI001C78CFFE|nr:hypothetical protein [Prescottella equi]BCN82791.1 hypothetical protein RE0356_14320 [Prescottella equi]
MQKLGSGGFYEVLDEVTVSVHEKSARRLDIPREARDDDDEPITITCRFLIKPDFVAVRIALRAESEHSNVTSDVAVSYEWVSPLEYDEPDLNEFIAMEAVPRCLTAASTLFAEAAVSVGEEPELHAVRIEKEMIEALSERPVKPNSAGNRG